MSTLETFIREHRNDLDVYTPSASVWSGIESGINHPTFVKSTVSWLKYAGFSASVIAALVYLKVNTSDATSSLPAESPRVEVAEAAVAPVTAPKAETSILAPAPEKIIAEPIQKTPFVPTLQEEPTMSAPAPVASAPITKTPAPEPASNKTGSWTAIADTLKIDTSFTGVKIIEVESSSFDISVRGVPGDKVSFQAMGVTQPGLFSKRNRTVKYEQNNDVLKITEERISKEIEVTTESKEKEKEKEKEKKKEKESGDKKKNKDCKESDKCKTYKDCKVYCEHEESSKLILEVPASANILIRSSYGDVVISNLQNKSCNITAHSGDVKLDNLTTELALMMGYGDLSATNITGNVGGKISSGDVSFLTLKGNVDLQTSYGDQSYTDVTGNIKALCSSGDFKISGMKGDLDINSKYGDIHLADYKGNPILNTSSGDIKGKNVELLEKMEANTHYGDIKMKFVNDLKALSFDLETSYGSISIERDGLKIEEDNHLVLKNGSIQVKAHTSSGDQSYK